MLSLKELQAKLGADINLCVGIIAGSAFFWLVWSLWVSLMPEKRW